MGKDRLTPGEVYDRLARDQVYQEVVVRELPESLSFPDRKTFLKLWSSAPDSTRNYFTFIARNGYQTWCEQEKRKMKRVMDEFGFHNQQI